ncbi:MAG: beta-N-acetylhexosaminidase [Phycisphaerales bacterium]|jgi:hexosaminidase|nr:beta-N-acetylhexosaminidase [Phycisphaerales bacterium]
MKRVMIILLAVLGFCAAGFAQTIIPKPETVVMKTGKFTPNAETKIVLLAQADQLKSAGDLLAGYLKESLGLNLTVTRKPVANAIVLALATKDMGLGSEGYLLDITTGGVKITANSECGVVYGIQSLRQLADASKDIPCMSVRDKPRYGWRGFMLDESRHFFGAAEVYKLLDRMAFYKLNRFHWHLTDMPGWRIEIKKYPKLTSVGGKGCDSDKNAPVKFYTQAEIKKIIAYARIRGIVVVPEIDMPGHATAANRAYPEHSGGGSKRHPEFTFNPGKEATYEYLTDILTETAALFPSPWLHFGGDEAHYGNQQWPSLPEVQTRMKKLKYTKLVEIEHYFNRRMADVISSLGKTTIGWDEVTGSGVKPSQAIVMWWRHNKPKALDAALDKGFKVILCPRVPCYFDFVQHSSHKSGRRWKKKFGDLPKVYAFPEGLIDKYDGKKQAQIMGIQACLWTEKVKEVKRLEFMTFPRIAALAEAAWTQKSNKDYAEFQTRLRSHLKQYAKWGIYYFDPFAPPLVKEPVGP